MGRIKISKREKSFLSFKNFVIVLGILILDVAVYLILGVAMMRYDDFHDENDPDYLSLSSMDLTDKIIHISLGIWNAINLLVLGYIIYRLIKWRVKSGYRYVEEQNKK